MSEPDQKPISDMTVEELVQGICDDLDLSHEILQQARAEMMQAKEWRMKVGTLRILPAES